MSHAPCRYTDPNGHCVWDACIGEALIVVGLATLAYAGWYYEYSPAAELNRGMFAYNFEHNVEALKDASDSLLQQTQAFAKRSQTSRQLVGQLASHLAMRFGQASVGGFDPRKFGHDPKDWRPDSQHANKLAKDMRNILRDLKEQVGEDGNLQNWMDTNYEQLAMTQEDAADFMEYLQDYGNYVLPNDLAQGWVNEKTAAEILQMLQSMGVIPPVVP